ncbi:MAG: KpsF/GutQ family sugar-phosphate isomerase [Candidatus Cloacimonetes bacterium]|nr:KpsF/GutQ family sugar-phosphate isomerase [Candidatus Cloacimonadota bacterium]
MSSEEGVKAALEVVAQSAAGIFSLTTLLQGEEFLRAVQILSSSKGRVVVTGLGKSGLIGRKICATLASTGTPALFMHPAEALHGDLGMTVPDDVFLALSNSGHTEELIGLLPSLKLFGNKLIAITGNADSVLAKNADAAIVYQIEKEGCPLNLAPMATTTASLVIGDAMAAALMKIKHFESHDFARFHPRGALGRKLLTRVKDLMSHQLPLVSGDQSMFEALEILIATNLGAVLVPGDNQGLLGLISDGDIKRLLKNRDNLDSLKVTSVMTRSPVTVEEDMLAEEALRIMQNPSRFVTVVPVMKENKLTGLLRMHDILQAKIR